MAAGRGAIQRIGLFGGTFNPVHLGHLMIAEHIREAANLERILFIPAYIHPTKKDQNIAPAEDRLQMLRIGLQDNPFFSVSEVELQKQGVSYTIETVRSLRKQYPPEQAELYFLVGGDNLAEFSTWKKVPELLILCRFISFGRPGFPRDNLAPPYRPYFQFVETPLVEISGTEIRSRIREKKSIRYLVPPAVEDYIRSNSLYSK